MTRQLEAATWCGRDVDRRREERGMKRASMDAVLVI